MAISRQTKEKQLAELTEKMKQSVGIAFASFEHTTVEEAQTIRRDLRSQDMEYTVIKKTLIAIALKEAKDITISSDDLDGMVAVITSTADEIAPSAAIKKYRKELYDKKSDILKVDFSGSIFNGAFLNSEETAQIADTPTREESLARILGALRFGPRGIHSALRHGLGGIARALKEADKFTTS